jgi:hypothetical protein
MIAHEVMIAALTVDLGCKAVRIAPAFAAAIACDDDGESDKDLTDRAISKPAC